MERSELEAWLRLSLTDGVGNGAARKLLAAFGAPEAVFGQTEAALGQVVSPAQAMAINQTPAALRALLEITWEWLRNTNATRHQVAVLGAANYPASLLTMEDPPLMLYLMGGPQPHSASTSESDEVSCAVTDWQASGLRDCIAIVGSRNPTPQGAANARNFGQALAGAGLTIVSGLAHGVDGAAHEGALASLLGASPRMATIAVVGTGLDRVYPKEHRELAHRIASNGLLMSEYPLGTPPLAANFPRRNRIIAGLAQGTLVVEAALKSGSLITARLAADQGKEVFAIPGSIHATQSRGCHALIKQGAKLVESAQDVLEELRLDFGQPQVDSASGDQPATIIEADRALLEALGFDPVGLDALQARCGLGTAAIQAQLMTLELDGHVARLPGGLFQRIM
ncbi:DNA-processing protein DprA [Rhodoferax sp.]|uniref:DNA-processing protein DprA n=1 Tax=Rhodoferax sp. TaxID=50421 RepID=UPI00275BB194|nr:DNA-processing protein DprA [Rhodoferax sp.]